MRKTLTFFLSVFLITLSLSAQTIYVKSDATGSNNGNSWTNAYTDLHTALENAPEGATLWIAQGTYITGDITTSFEITKNLNIYASFFGTETSLEQRNIASYPTILSGDNNGDDLPANRVINREDNSIHVLILEEGLTNVLLDGLTVEGGHTKRRVDVDDGTNSSYGAGILNLGASLSLKNCIFMENSAGNDGGAIFLDPSPGVSLTIENCTFTENGSDFRGGGIFVGTPRAEINITGTTFDENLAIHGAAIYYGGQNANLNIDNCSFTNGFTTGTAGAISVQIGNSKITNSQFKENRAYDYGGALHISGDLTNLELENCTIENNEVSESDGRGGGLSIFLGAKASLINCNISNNTSSFLGGAIELESEPTALNINGGTISGNTAETAGGGIIAILGASLSISDCTISENSSNEGGGVYLQNAANYNFNNIVFNKNTAAIDGGGLYVDIQEGLLINNCQFLENSAETNGGGIYARDGEGIQISNTSFSNNKASYGGGISSNFENTVVSIANSTFEGNEAINNGGALEAFDLASYLVDSCYFKKNKADYGGGINLQSEGTHLTLMNSIFEENEVAVQGGALGMFNGTVSKVYNTSFLRNIANRNGGAINLSSSGVVTETQIFDACIFDGNQSFENSEGLGGYGGAIITFNANAQISNCLFINNSCVSGGTVQLNDSDENQDVTSMINCTFANNSDANTASIYAWDNGSGDNVNLVLQNNLFADPETGFQNEEGAAQVTSNGGNLCINETMSEVLNHARDLHNTDPIFKNPNSDYRLAAISPAINAGVTTNAPEKDLAGNVRDALVDIGAYESQEVTSIFNQLIEAGQLSIYPNPVQDNLQFSLESDWNGSFTMSILNIKGQTIWKKRATKTTPNLQKTIALSHLPAATYLLRIEKKEQVSSRLFVKN